MPDVSIPDHPNALKKLFYKQRAHRGAIKRTGYQERTEKLKSLEESLLTHREAIHNVLFEDFGKPPEETDLTEISVVLTEIAHATKNLKSWMTPGQVRSPLKLIGTKSDVYYEPKGTILIMGPWNYPLNLMLCPLVSAIAAGNTVILKPSEHAPQTSHFVKWLVDHLFPEEEVAVIEGDVEVARSLLALPFDHIFFTGSSSVGRLVMKAAAEHLTPVTLELGGKSPALVDTSASLPSAAERIAYGKFSNAGQTCIAPDYLLVHESIMDECLEQLKRYINRLFPAHLNGQKGSYGYARIINRTHFDRLVSLLEDATHKGARIELGGAHDASKLLLTPTLLTNASTDMRVMQEEIFGPILPVFPYSSLEEALAFINERPRPLALYIFSQDADAIDQICQNTSSGGITINETLIQYANPDLPFGGIGASGMGKAHGRHGFLAFSNERAVLRVWTPRSPLKFFYPPYTKRTRTFIDYLLKYL